jgi:hypothetical protein
MPHVAVANIYGDELPQPALIIEEVAAQVRCECSELSKCLLNGCALNLYSVSVARVTLQRGGNEYGYRHG